MNCVYRAVEIYHAHESRLTLLVFKHFGSSTVSHCLFVDDTSLRNSLKFQSYELAYI